MRKIIDPSRSGELKRLIIVGLVLIPIAMVATCVIAEIRELPWWCRLRANLGSTEMQYKMGRICSDMEANREAEEWYRKAAENGSVDAQYELARFSKDEEERLLLLKLAAGNDHPKAQYELGVKYFQVGPEHYATAVEWYQQAAAQGLPEAQHALAGCLRYGYGVEAPDVKRAKELYQQAAAQGYGPSEAQLEELLEAEKKAKGTPAP